MTDDRPTGSGWLPKPPPQSRAAVVVGCVLFVLLGLAVAYAVDPELFRWALRDLGIR